LKKEEDPFYLLPPPHFTLLSFFPFALAFARAKAKGRKKEKRGAASLGGA
jgi:hypothetical protein